MDGGCHRRPADSKRAVVPPQVDEGGAEESVCYQDLERKAVCYMGQASAQRELQTEKRRAR